MKMTKLSLAVLLVLFAQSIFALPKTAMTPQPEITIPQEFQDLDAQMQQMNLDDFMTMTPAKYKELTGKKMGIKNAVKLKAAQKLIKKQLKKDDASDVDIPKGLFIVLAILGWAWLVMGLMDDWKGNNWWITLLLTVLCWIPGVIYALVKMKDYY